MALFHFEDVTVDARPRPRIVDVTAEIVEGGITTVAGPSGSGKTTLLRLCNRLEVPTAGRVLFRGEDVAALDPLHHRRRVGMVFQRPTLFGGTVADNLRAAAPHLDDAGIHELLDHVDLSPTFASRPADDLSGGEAQRVCLGRALAAGPEVMLMDEPTSALDARPRQTLEALARRMADEGTTVVWVTHDLRQLHRIADHVLVLIEGRVRWSGERSDVADGAGRETPPDVSAFLASTAAEGDGGAG